MTCQVYRHGSVWNAEASLPAPEHFKDDSVIRIGSDNGDEMALPFEYLACAIALIDLSVDKGVKAQ